MLLKCAACPASCMSVASAFLPEPHEVGSASDVKLVTVGCHDPSPRVHAGCGQWQKLRFLSLHFISFFHFHCHFHTTFFSSFFETSKYESAAITPVGVLALAVEEVERHGRAAVDDAWNHSVAFFERVS